MNINSKKTQKPIEIDAYLKYRCPSCNIDHWISLNQATTKNYKVVCDCNQVFKPKRISKINIEYAVKQKPKLSDSDILTIESNLLNQCVSVLVQYGFTSGEAQSLVKETYLKNPTTDLKQLITNTLSSIGVSNE